MLPNFEQELAEKAAESIDWLPLEAGAYLRVSNVGKQDCVVITSLPDAGIDGENLLMLVLEWLRPLCLVFGRP